MGTDYISREAAVKKFSDRLQSISEEYICKIAEEIPPADVRPVVRGEWEEIEIIPDAYDISGVITWASEMRCQKCGFTTYAIEGRFLQYNFCPNCGAKMKGTP